MPWIDAYAVDHTIIYIGATVQNEGEDYSISNGLISWSATMAPAFSGNHTLHLHIYHKGIKSYEDLFYFIGDAHEKQRMASYYQESENNLESGNNLAFALMASGIFEGLLRNLFLLKSGNIPKDKKNPKFDVGFAVLISEAFKKSFINKDEKTILDHARLARNCIHPAKKGNLISRKEALEMSVLLDRFITNNW